MYNIAYLVYCPINRHLYQQWNTSCVIQNHVTKTMCDVIEKIWYLGTTIKYTSNQKQHTNHKYHKIFAIHNKLIVNVNVSMRMQTNQTLFDMAHLSFKILPTLLRYRLHHLTIVLIVQYAVS